MIEVTVQINITKAPSTGYGLFFWLHYKACRILVPQQGIQPVPLAVEAWSLNHWTTREVLICFFFLDMDFLNKYF